LLGGTPARTLRRHEKRDSSSCVLRRLFLPDPCRDATRDLGAPAPTRRLQAVCEATTDQAAGASPAGRPSRGRSLSSSGGFHQRTQPGGHLASSASSPRSVSPCPSPRSRSTWSVA
jgi:hypothetical protein